MMTTTFSQHTAERKFADTLKGIFRKERETRKHLRLPYVAAKRRFESLLIANGYEDRMATEIASRAAEVAMLEYEVEREA